MSSTTISQSTSHDSSVSRKKSRASQFLSPVKSYKPSSGKWRLRTLWHPARLSAEHERHAYQILNKFSGRRDFSLPSHLPPWSPNPDRDDTTPNLDYIRHYGPLPPAEPLDHRSRPLAAPSPPPMSEPDSAPTRASKPSRPEPVSKKPSPAPAPPPPAASSSASPDTYSSPPHPPPKASTTRHKPAVEKRAETDRDRERERERECVKEPPPTFERAMAAGKGKERVESIDWSGWGPQHYLFEQIDRVRYQYEQRAKELKRLSDSQHHQIALAREARADGGATISADEIIRLGGLATIESVDALLLFTQAFLCSDLVRAANGGAGRRAEQCRQWESMQGFLQIAKLMARKSGIDLAFGLILMYESLLLDRLVEAERPMVLQMHAHATDPEAQAEGFQRFKKLLSNQELSRTSWLQADALFQHILSPSSTSTPPSAKNPTLHRLNSLTKAMRLRRRTLSPSLLSIDRPWRFCWPIDKSDPDCMSDFVVFARAALEEWCELSGCEYRLKRFGDFEAVFPGC